MSDRFNRRLFLRRAAAALPLAASGCGTVFWNERKDQPHSGRIDTKVLLLDCCGLLLFGIGGVLALAVDFATGAIYLPAGQTHATAGDEASLVKVQVDGDLSPDKIEAVAAEHFGRPVNLRGADVQRSELASVDDFFPAVRRMFQG